MREPLSRTVDACLNRASEGLRVLMDLARFELDSPSWSDEYRLLRHTLVRALGTGPGAVSPLLAARDSVEDVGRPDSQSHLPPVYRDLLDLFQANSRRVEEALRSLEEFHRLTDPGKSRQIETLRYRTYDLQKEVGPVVLYHTHRGRMDFELYVVTNRSLSRGRPPGEVVRSAIRGGAGCIQLREKGTPIREFLAIARELRHLCREEGVTFIVNDALEVALEVEADGIHLGQDDLPLEVARKISKGSLLIGISTHNPEEALEAQTGGAGYINIGPIFPTATKNNPMAPVTPELVRLLAPRIEVPFTTMGGIHLENVEQVILAGADRVAVVSEVVAAPDIEAAARGMLEAIRRAKQKRAAESGAGETQDPLPQRS